MIDEVKLKARADALRQALFSGLPLSDGDVIKRAIEDPRLEDTDKAILRQEFGENPASSFLKGVGRGAGLDLVGKALSYTPAGWAIDKVTQTLNPQAPSIGEADKVLNAQPLQTGANTAANIAGRVGGNILSVAIPGSPLLKAGKAGRMGFAALQGLGSISQNLGDQSEEMILGDRTEYNVPGMAASAAVSALGGYALPSVVNLQRATKGVPGSLGYMAKYAGKGAVAGGVEGGMDAALYNALESDDNLSVSGREKSSDVWTAAITGGLMGAGLGGAFDALDARHAGRAIPTPAPNPLPPVGHPANPVARAATPAPQPTLQTPEYNPENLDRALWQEVNAWTQSPDYAELLARGVGGGSHEQIVSAVVAAAEKLKSGRTREQMVDRRNGKTLPVVSIRELRRLMIFDPETNELRIVPLKAIKSISDRIYLSGNLDARPTAYGYPGEHRRVPKAQGPHRSAFTYQGRAYKPVSFRSDLSELGAVPVDALQEGGMNKVEILPLDPSMMVGEESYREALRRALSDETAPTATPAGNPRTYDQYEPVSSLPEFLNQEWTQAPGGVKQLEELLRRHAKPVRQ